MTRVIDDELASIKAKKELRFKIIDLQRELEALKEELRALYNFTPSVSLCSEIMQPWSVNHD